MKDAKFKDYYLGLDIGTDSVGWCCTDPEYHVLKFHGKAMWGVRLFDEASSAADRRVFRTSRRRLDRRQRRVAITEELLAPLVTAIDPGFYVRMKESRFLLDDKEESARTPYTLFADRNYTDKDYHKEFPTIYHLRKALMRHEHVYDIRLYCLAIIHFMKHRGHFLFEGELSEARSFDYVFGHLNDYIEQEYDQSLDPINLQKIQDTLLDRTIGRSEKKRILTNCFNWVSDNARENDSSSINLKEVVAAIAGTTVPLEKLFYNPEYKDLDPSKICLADGIDDAKLESLQSSLGERFELIALIKSVYDWSVLSGILSGYDSISDAQIGVYEKHRRDLIDLKYVVRKYCPDQYKKVFWDSEIKNNYTSYVRHSAYKNKPVADKRSTEQREFCDFIKSLLMKIDADDATLVRIKKEAEVGIFMPKQVSKSNQVIPYQVHLQELEKILQHLGEDYPELMTLQEDGYSICEKLKMLFEFRIPYYVGPLNNQGKNSENTWVVRRESGPVYPWNFEEKVDVESSANRFIRRMTNKCTYLIGEDVVPSDSLLYAKYLVLNDLNNLKVDGVRLPVSLKQRIYTDVFKKQVIRGKVTLRKLKQWLLQENLIEKDQELSGIDDSFKNELKAYHALKTILGSRVDEDPAFMEQIITDIVIFGEDKPLLIKRLYSLGKTLSDEEIKKLARLSFTGWGRFSAKFLNEIQDVNRETGELLTIIQSLWEGQENLMELLSSEHGYSEQIREINMSTVGYRTDISYDLVKESYASPAVKRGIWQTLKIIRELQTITGFSPSRIFVETAREKDDKQGRTVSRRLALIERYKAIRDDSRDWLGELTNKYTDRDLNSKKLYLYYCQMGRDMYTGKEIDLSSLFTSEYDLDHIYPRSLTKDDSIINNLVLVRSEYNRDKSDEYPIADKYRCTSLWKLLKDKDLISEEKYNRLVRRTPLTDEELAGFISRQLVETRQTTKLVCEILKEVMPDSKIVYSKASAVSEFRQQHNYVKVRSVNDYHHAKDAYLNIIVGNVYYTKFTENPYRYIHQDVRRSGGKEKYSLNRMFDFDVNRNGVIAWRSGEHGTIETVEQNMRKNNILFTRYATEKRGGLFDQMPLRKGSGDLLPLKTADSRFDISKYGGYNKPSINYFMLVESDARRGKKRTLEGVPVYLSGASEDDLLIYCREKLGLVNPNIWIKEVRINSLLKLNGYPMHISGKSNNRIIIKNAVQLVISPEVEIICKKIERVCEKLSTLRDYTIDVDHDAITKDDTKCCYDALKDKAESTIFKNRPASPLTTLQSGSDRFEALEIEEQCILLSELLKLYQCRSFNADLKAIGGAAHAGAAMVGNEISKCQEALLINQSITGLRESIIDLLTI